MSRLSEGVISHYERHAHAWDSDRRSNDWTDKPWHERFMAALPKHASVLDLGCGSGAPVAVQMVACGFRVTGIDASPTMISLCKKRLPDQEWLVADMRSLRLNRRFDAILAWDSFFHLAPDDQRQMFNVFSAHAAASATLMFNAGPAHGQAIGEYRGDPLYHASLSIEENEGLLAQQGFKVVSHAVNDWQQGGGRTVWIAQRTDRTADTG